MSTHYTAHRNAPLWTRFLANVFLPFLLLSAVGAALSDGGGYWSLPLIAVTDCYITFRVVTWLAQGKEKEIWLRVIAMQLLLYSIYLTNTAYAQSANDIMLTEITSALCLAGSFTAEHHRRLAKLTAPTDHSRAQEYPGIYRITCRPNGKHYLGQTSQAINARWAEHRKMLASRRHHNHWLQADWDLYRPEQFTWEVLEVVTDSVWLLDRERAWQDMDYDAAKRYNPPNIPPRIEKAAVKGKRPIHRRRSA